MRKAPTLTEKSKKQRYNKKRHQKLRLHNDCGLRTTATQRGSLNRFTGPNLFSSIHRKSHHKIGEIQTAGKDAGHGILSHLYLSGHDRKWLRYWRHQLPGSQRNQSHHRILVRVFSLFMLYFKMWYLSKHKSLFVLKNYRPNLRTDYPYMTCTA